jgi:alkylation response protein AidB-like acyl-CoA dehydrogenase
MQACMDVVLPYVHERKQFGQAIGEFQLMQGKVADMYVDLSGGRAYVYAVGQGLRPRDQTLRKDAAGAILYAAEKATWMAGEAIQAWAATATSTTTRPAACCATPSSTRSAPAPQRDPPHADRPRAVEAAAAGRIRRSARQCAPRG